jgi:hypothetical protein
MRLLAGDGNAAYLFKTRPGSGFSARHSFALQFALCTEPP